MHYQYAADGPIKRTTNRLRPPGTDSESGRGNRLDVRQRSPIGALPKAALDPSSAHGESLGTRTRAEMERSFARDLGVVRIHTDAAAARSAREVEAHAYTVGPHIVFGAGQYAPDTMTGKRLLAHELAHVIQQSSSHGVRSQLERPDINQLESEADRAAVAASEGRYSSIHLAAGLYLNDGCSNTVPMSELVLQRKASNLEMWQERTDQDEEAQRKEAFNIVRQHRSEIIAEAVKFKVPAEAIAGAIFWEALENPYHRSFSRLGPGKVHPTETFGKSEAEKVEEEKRVPVAKDLTEREVRLHDPVGAITYIAAIMRRHADNYMRIAGVDISGNVGVLCTLYQGGKSEERAQKLADKRKTDPTAQPQMGDEMGPWVVKNIETIRGWVNPPPRPH